MMTLSGVSRAVSEFVLDVTGLDYNSRIGRELIDYGHRQGEHDRLAPHEKAFVREIGRFSAHSGDWEIQQHTLNPESEPEESICGFKMESDGVTFKVSMTASGFALSRESYTQSPIVITSPHIGQHLFDRLVSRADIGAFEGNARSEVEWPGGASGVC